MTLLPSSSSSSFFFLSILPPPLPILTITVVAVTCRHLHPCHTLLYPLAFLTTLPTSTTNPPSPLLPPLYLCFSLSFFLFNPSYLHHHQPSLTVNADTSTRHCSFFCFCTSSSASTSTNPPTRVHPRRVLHPLSRSPHLLRIPSWFSTLFFDFTKLQWRCFATTITTSLPSSPLIPLTILPRCLHFMQSPTLPAKLVVINSVPVSPLFRLEFENNLILVSILPLSFIVSLLAYCSQRECLLVRVHGHLRETLFDMCQFDLHCKNLRK